MAIHCRTTWDCPHCGERLHCESLFQQWLRLQHSTGNIRSDDAFVFSDLDMICHRYRWYGDRKVKCLMVVEVKTFGAKPNQSQRETLSLFSQLVRNRRDTPTKSNDRRQATDRPVYAWNLDNERVYLRAMGAHLLTFSHKGPQDSDWIRWDNSEISESQLIKLLRFELDPDTIKPLDMRPHHLTVIETTESDLGFPVEAIHPLFGGNED